MHMPFSPTRAIINVITLHIESLLILSKIYYCTLSGPGSINGAALATGSAGGLGAPSRPVHCKECVAMGGIFVSKLWIDIFSIICCLDQSQRTGHEAVGANGVGRGDF
jgi:hypothetical protein